VFLVLYLPFLGALLGFTTGELLAVKRIHFDNIIYVLFFIGNWGFTCLTCVCVCVYVCVCMSVCVCVCVYIYIYIYIYVHTDRQTVRQTERQTDRQTDRQTGFVGSRFSLYAAD
jgi:hypothetical protein